MHEIFDLSFSPKVLLARLACAAALGAILAWRPLCRRAVRTEVEHSLLIMTVAAAMMVTVIGDSLARAFGVVGLGSFIRFRSSIKDPRDVTLFFVAIGTGMACGLGAVPTAAISVLVLWFILVALDRVGAAPAPKPAPHAPPAPHDVP
jgi:hypothetical protein